ncbi:Rhomboid protease GlpG [Rosistilla carotiformis]|uniref:Rhomboid protease GlpG n=1 Tax=Rosistilla carotiformis TaxID=2528017 RepID=A0A518JTL3_9BACT|nr:rhomboid family intramembrane serine protease [Rosistilla carotiformis]QDV68889.1 Rhomboid protease GlpG [Rosistilla carotiformis]
MRKIGEFTNPEQASQFCDYLLTISISATAEESNTDPVAWAVWIHDEDRLNVARAELDAFRQQPGDAKYRVYKQADEIRKQQEAKNKDRLKQQRKVGGAAWAGSGNFVTQKPRLTIALVVTCVVLFFLTDPGSRGVRDDAGAQLFQELRFVGVQDYVESEGDPLASIKKGQIWRVFTPNLLHGSMMHLGFNMMALFFLGGAIERLQSPMALAVLVLLTGITAIVVQSIFPASLGGSPNVIGISGAVYGLFGYLWIRPILQPSFPNLIPPSTVMLMLVFMFMFILLPQGSMGGQSIANVAHVAGLLMGIGCAAVASRMPT